jgi:hypothetical protein
MFNRVKFVINKNLLQASKNKKGFEKIKKYNKNNSNNKNVFGTRTSIRNFSSYSNKPPNDPSNMIIIIATIFCGSLFMYKRKNKKL